MSRYARGTEVPVDRSIGEIKRVLAAYGANAVLAGDGKVGRTGISPSSEETR